MPEDTNNDKTPAEIELEDSLNSIRVVGENASGEGGATDDAKGEQNPNPPLPDWGTDGVPAGDEPAE